MKSKIAAAATAASVLALGLAAAQSTGEVPYPEGYRGWHHVKSMLIEEGHPLFAAFGGIHHLYANDAALEGYRSGRFPDGAVIVFDLLEAVADGNAVVEGERKAIGVMHRDARAYSQTGGWGFELFAGGRSGEHAGQGAACFACHEAQAGPDFVFSEYRP